MAQYVRIGLFAIQVNNADCCWIRTRKFLLPFNKLIVFLYVFVYRCKDEDDVLDSS